MERLTIFEVALIIVSAIFFVRGFYHFIKDIYLK